MGGVRQRIFNDGDRVWCIHQKIVKNCIVLSYTSPRYYLKSGDLQFYKKAEFLNPGEFNKKIDIQIELN